MARYRPVQQWVAWLLVALQLALLAAVVLLPGPRVWPESGWLNAIAVVLIVLAAGVAGAATLRLGAGFTASPLPARAAQLRTTGVYACVRHPIYAALLLGGAGAVLVGGRLTRVVAWLALLLILLVKARVEEAALTARFPDYPRYAAVTPRLVPNPLRCLAGRR